MKLSEKIEELQKAIEEYGDVDVIYSCDEGENRFDECGGGVLLYAELSKGKLPSHNIEIYI